MRIGIERLSWLYRLTVYHGHISSRVFSNQIKTRKKKLPGSHHSFLNNRRHSLVTHSSLPHIVTHSWFVCVGCGCATISFHYRLSFQATSRHLSSETPSSFMKQTTPEKREKPTIIPIISYQYQSHSFPTISIYPSQFLSTSPNSLWNFHPPLNLFDFDVNRIHYYITKSKQNRWFQQFVIKAYHPNPMHIHSVDFLLTSYPATIWTYSIYLLYLSLLTFVFFSPFFFRTDWSWLGFWGYIDNLSSLFLSHKEVFILFFFSFF